MSNDATPVAQMALELWEKHGDKRIIVVSDIYDHVWWWRTRLPERKGHPCRVRVRAKRMNSVLVEFTDGYTVVTSRYAVRKRKQ